MAKRGPNLLNPRLAKALEHQIRTEILSILRQGPSSPARIERQLESVSLNLISHHMKVLKELGCVELVETINRRGAREHVYRAVGPVILGKEEWEELPQGQRKTVTVSILRMISEDLAQSLGSGEFDEIDDSHLSRTPLRLDSKGWSAVATVLERALAEVLELGAESSERIETGEETWIPATVAIMQFPRSGDGP